MTDYNMHHLRRLLCLVALLSFVAVGFRMQIEIQSLTSQLESAEAIISTQGERIDTLARYNAELETQLENSFPIPMTVSRGGDMKRLTEDEVKLIAKIVHAEAEGEPFEGKIMVARVVMNRAEQWGKTIEEVVYAHGQFCGTKRKCFMDGVFEVEDVKAVVKASMIDAPWTHFCNPETSSDKAFVNSKTWELRIGNHVFGR